MYPCAEPARRASCINMNDLESTSLDLTGKVLIAMPGMGDPRFEHSVVFMCAHSDEGAMGLIT